MNNPYLETVNGHTFRMIFVEGGAFDMGSADDDPEAYDSEKPRHRVTLPDFYMGEYPVTQALWKAVMGSNPSQFVGDDRPVEQVTWDDTQGFFRWLNAVTESTRHADHLYRLPSEAEWEYAARGGKYHADCFKYAGSDRLKDVGWYTENSDQETKPVGQKSPNQLGLYDLSGNVMEWCEDDGHDDYKDAPTNGSAWIDHLNRGSARLCRGGSCSTTARYCCIARRVIAAPINRVYSLGFRLVLAPHLKK